MTTEQYVMRCAGVAGQVLGPDNSQQSPVGQYLKSFDPEAHDGFGWADWTNSLAEAQRFDSQIEVFACWKQTSKVRPTRPWDGQPNRPLTVFTVEALTVAAAEAGESVLG